MFNVGIISNTGENECEVKNVLERHGCLNIVLSPHNYQEEISKVDAVVISDDKDVGQTCRFILNIRNSSNALVYVCSNKQMDNNRVLYLQLGADGVCVQKEELEGFPILVDNALKRVKPIVHKKEKTKRESRMVQSNSLEMIPENLSVLLNGKEEISLTRLEYILLDALYRKAGTAMSYQELSELAWKDQDSESQKYRVANIIFHVREKIEKNSKGKKFIKTIRSKGYMFDIQALDE